MDKIVHFYRFNSHNLFILIWIDNSASANKFWELTWHETAAMFLLGLKHELSEHYTVQGWSDETYWSAEGSAYVGATGKSAKGEDPHKHVWVHATIPDGTKMIKNEYKTREDYGGWGRWDGGPDYSNADKTISKRFKHWVHDKGRTVYLKVKYRKPINKTKTKKLKLMALGSQKPREDQHLAFGQWYEVRLDNNFQSYDLTLKYFNGKTYTLTPATLAEKVEAKLENKSNFKRLLVLAKP